MSHPWPLEVNLYRIRSNNMTFRILTAKKLKLPFHFQRHIGVFDFREKVAADYWPELTTKTIQPICICQILTSTSSAL